MIDGVPLGGESIHTVTPWTRSGSDITSWVISDRSKILITSTILPDPFLSSYSGTLPTGHKYLR
jgi:transcriptional accessory protein Tex/SPT6